MSTDYTQSPHWRRLRATIIKKRGAHCEQCSRTDGIQLHHLTYARLGAELETDVRLLCSDCHQAAHTFNATPYASTGRRGAGGRNAPLMSATVFPRPSLSRRKHRLAPGWRPRQYPA